MRSRGGVALFASTHRIPGLVPLGTSTPCVRGDLNPRSGEISPDLGLNSKTGEKSPDRGVHAIRVDGEPRLTSSGFRRDVMGLASLLQAGVHGPGQLVMLAIRLPRDVGSKKGDSWCHGPLHYAEVPSRGSPFTGSGLLRLGGLLRR
jgi:hypothetical protein